MKSAQDQDDRGKDKEVKAGLRNTRGHEQCPVKCGGPPFVTLSSAGAFFSSGENGRRKIRRGWRGYTLSRRCVALTCLGVFLEKSVLPVWEIYWLGIGGRLPGTKTGLLWKGFWHGKYAQFLSNDCKLSNWSFFLMASLTWKYKCSWNMKNMLVMYL